MCHGFGMTKQPDSWSSRNDRYRFAVAMGVGDGRSCESRHPEVPRKALVRGHPDLFRVRDLPWGIISPVGMTPPTDRALIAAASKGEIAAFATLIGRYRD